jgi:hypothetical protein
MTLPAKIRVNTTLPFPSLVKGSGPVTVAKNNGVWTVGLNFGVLGVQTPPPVKFSTDYVLVQDSIAQTFFKVPLSGLSSATGFPWKNIVTDFGAVGDGVTDDSPAFLNFQTYAKAQTNGVVLVIPPGVYNNPTANAFYTGIKNLTILGYGATIQYFSAGGPFLETGVGVNSARINSTNIGDTSVTCITHAQAALFTVGSWVNVSSVSMQTNSYPPDLYNNEFRQVTGSNASTGVVTLDQPLRYANLSTNPTPNNSPNPTDAGGPATIYNVRQSWVQTVKVYGATLDMLTGGQLVQFCAQYMSIEDCTILGNAGCSMTGGIEYTFKNCFFANGIELDKCIQSIRFYDCVHAQQLISLAASNDKMIVDSNEFWQGIVGTPAKQTHISDSYIESLFIGTTYGPGGALILDNCRIDKITPIFTGSEIGIGGIDLSYSNGVFSIANSSADLQLMYRWVPGQMGFLDYGGSIYAFPFVVTGITDDGTNTHLATNLGLATLPTITGLALTAGSIRTHSCPRLSARNNTGCDEVINISKAPSDSPWMTYSRRFFTGSISSGTIQAARQFGYITKIRVNVIRAYTGAQAQLNLFLEGQFGAFYFDTATNAGARWATAGVGAYVNTKVAGERDILLGSQTGIQGSDNVPALAATVWINFIAFPFFGDNSGNNVSVAGDNTNQWPIVELEITLNQQGTQYSNFYNNATLLTA